MKAKIISGKPTKILTRNKLYDVFNFDNIDHTVYGYGFSILNDIGERCFCLEKECAWLDGGDWELIYD